MHLIWLLVSFLAGSSVGNVVFDRAKVGLFRRSRSLPQEERIPDGFWRNPDHIQSMKARKGNKKGIKVSSLPELKKLFAEGYNVEDFDVRGDIHSILTTNPTTIHPLVQLLHERKRNGSKPMQRDDKMKIALAIEGGGMRGCVATGMVVALWHLGLDETIDVIYGSSAGAIVGAYYIAKHVPLEGPEIYYDILTTSGKDFIDSKSILRSIGLGILDIRPRSLWSLLRDRMGKPVFNLNFVCNKVLQELKPLNWSLFWSKQVTYEQPLKVVASGLLSHQSVVFSASDGHFESVSELAECIKASMALPGITGDPIRLKGRQIQSVDSSADQLASNQNVGIKSNLASVLYPEYPHRGKTVMTPGSEPYSDALLFEPIPYRSAMIPHGDNCTHAIILRTRGDGIRVTNKMSMIEKLIMRRFFGRKLQLPGLANWMLKQYHKLIYAEDILRTNAENRNFKPLTDVNGPKLFAIAMPAGIKEVRRTETSRKIIFENVKYGFAAAYDSLVNDPALRGNGMKIADELWPEDILSRPPKHLQGVTTVEEKQSK